MGFNDFSHEYDEYTTVKYMMNRVIYLVFIVILLLLLADLCFSKQSSFTKTRE